MATRAGLFGFGVPSALTEASPPVLGHPHVRGASMMLRSPSNGYEPGRSCKRATDGGRTLRSKKLAALLAALFLAASTLAGCGGGGEEGQDQQQEQQENGEQEGGGGEEQEGGGGEE